MNTFTVEQMNLISIYHTGARQSTIEEMTAALPDMDSDIQQLARRTLDRLHAMNDEEYSQLAIDPADEQDG
jgi:hypothetical protein